MAGCQDDPRQYRQPLFPNLVDPCSRSSRMTPVDIVNPQAQTWGSHARSLTTSSASLPYDAARHSLLGSWNLIFLVIVNRRDSLLSAALTFDGPRADIESAGAALVATTRCWLRISIKTWNLIPKGSWKSL
ncbi:hypothetical protein VDGL01_09338 [Verticillium dahliae]